MKLIRNWFECVFFIITHCLFMFYTALNFFFHFSVQLCCGHNRTIILILLQHCSLGKLHVEKGIIYLIYVI